MPREYSITSTYGGIGGNITTSRSDLAEVYKGLCTNHTRNRNITTKGLSSKRPGTRIIDKLPDTFNPTRCLSWYKNKDENYLISLYKNADSTDIGTTIYKKEGERYTNLGSNYSKDSGQTIMSKYAADALIKSNVRQIQSLPHNDVMYMTTGAYFPMVLRKDASENFTLKMWEGVPPMIQKLNGTSVDEVAQKTLVDTNLVDDLATARLYVKEIPTGDENKTIKLMETETAPYWEIKVVDADVDDIAMAAGFYVFDWYSPPNAVTTFRNSLVFGGSRLNASTIWSSVPQKFNSFIINAKGLENVVLAEVYTLDTTLEVLSLVAVEDFMVAFNRQETIFINRNLEARKQSGNGVSDTILPVLDNKNIYVVNQENELIVWVWTGDIQGGWQHVNLTQTNDIDLITGNIINLGGFRYVDSVSTKRAAYEGGYYLDKRFTSASDSELIQVNYNNIMVLTDERLVGLNILGNNILVNGEWELSGAEILDIASDYSNLYAQLRTSEGTYLVEFNKDIDQDYITRIVEAADNHEKIVTSYANAGTTLTDEDFSGDKYNLDVGNSMTIQAKYTYLARDIPLIQHVDNANIFGSDYDKINNILTREQDNPLLGYREPIKFDLGFHNLEVALIPRVNDSGSYVWQKEVQPSTLVTNIYQQFDLYVRDKNTGFGGRLGGSFNIKYDNLRLVVRHEKDVDIIGDIYPAEFLFGITRLEANKIGVIFGTTRSSAVGFTEQVYTQNGVAIQNKDEIEKFMAYKYDNYGTIFITVFYSRIIFADKTRIKAASNDAEYEAAVVNILNNDTRRPTYNSTITAETIVPDIINIKTIIDVVPPTVNIVVGGNVNREYIPYNIKGVNINVVHSDGVAVVKHRGRAIASIQTDTFNKEDFFGGTKRLQRSFQYKQGMGGNTERFRTQPFYSIEHGGRGKFLISDYTANLEV